MALRPKRAREHTHPFKSERTGSGCQEVKFHAQSWAPDLSLWFTHSVPPPSHGFDFRFLLKRLHFALLFELASKPVWEGHADISGVSVL